MRKIAKTSTKNRLMETQKPLKKITKNRKKSKLADFYGAMPGVYGNGIEYQKKIRSEWRNF